eukprot:1599481-Rhodomonas_salina.1
MAREAKTEDEIKVRQHDRATSTFEYLEEPQRCWPPQEAFCLSLSTVLLVVLLIVTAVDGVWMRAGLQATEGVLIKVDKALKESFTLGRGKAKEEKARIAKHDTGRQDRTCRSGGLGTSRPDARVSTGAVGAAWGDKN